MRRKRRLHKPGFKATVALTAIKAELTMAVMVKKKVSLGLVEGVNNKIRVIQRKAYGYRDE